MNYKPRARERARARSIDARARSLDARALDVGRERADAVRAGGDDVLGTLPRDDLEPAGARADAGRDGALALVETLLGELRREGVETDATGATGEGGGGGEDHDARRGVGRVGRAARGEVERRRDVR